MGTKRLGIPLRVQDWELEGVGGSPILSPVLCKAATADSILWMIDSPIWQDPGEQRQKPSFSGQFELISDPFPLLFFFFPTFSVFCFIMRCWVCFIYVMEMESHQL